MKGFDTAAEIQIAPELPEVMLTYDARPRDTARRQQAGLSGYALKPLKRSERLVGGAMNRLESPAVMQPHPADRKEAGSERE